MSMPVAVAAGDLLEFVGNAGLAVVLVSIHPLHAFSEALCRQLQREHPEVALGTVDLRDLMREGGPALRFLQLGLRACGAPQALGVLPGYCLFRQGEMLAWNAGLPGPGDVEAIARGALLGAVWSGVSHDFRFLTRALHLAAEQAGAQRAGAVFGHAVAAANAHRESRDRPGPPPFDDLYWAYEVLGVHPAATDREIHLAWRKRRMEAHPDHVTQDPEEFVRRSRISAEINRARDIIVNHRSGGTRRSADAGL